MTPDEFARECDDAAKAVRRLPRDLRRAFAQRTRDEVAEPLAARMRASGGGVYGRRVSATAKARSQADPTIVVGGARRVASGGASARDLLWGNEFGGGKKVRALVGNARRRGHRRRTTQQFVRNQSPFLYNTLSRSWDWALDKWATIADETINEGMKGDG